MAGTSIYSVYRRTEGSETRLTDLQKEMFRRYKENRDYEQAQDSYRT